MKKTLFPILLVVFAALLGVMAYWQWQETRDSTPGQQIPVETPLTPDEPPAPRYPIPAPAPQPAADETLPSPAQDQPEQEPVSEAPLPGLNESDAPVAALMSDLFSAERVRELFHLDEIVRRFVVSIDNLPQKKLPRRQFIVKPVSGPFLVTGEEDAWAISPDNAARYTPYVRLMTAVATEDLAALYLKHYPLFQEAYVELGYPGAYFNDRLVEVIDLLLATPEVDEPIPLVRPHVFYQYADPDLEALSAGQKILLRMGRENAGAVKAKLMDLRRAVTRED